MYVNNFKSKFRPKSMSRPNKNKPSHRPKYPYASRNIENKMHPGIFRKGRSTGSVLRGIDGPISQETLARAEENLSLLFELTNQDRPESEIVLNKCEDNINISPNFDNSEEFVKRSTKTRKLYRPRRYYHKDRVEFKNDNKENGPPWPQGRHKPETERNSRGSGCSSTKQFRIDLHSPLGIKSIVAPSIEKKLNLRSPFDDVEKSPDKRDEDKGASRKSRPMCEESCEIPYNKFARPLKASLKKASINLLEDCDLNSELRQVLKDTYDNCSWQYTPPSGLKGVAQYLHELSTSTSETSSNKGTSNPPQQKRKLSESTSSSSSAVTPNFEPVTNTLTLIISPRRLIRRYEKKRQECSDNQIDLISNTYEPLAKHSISTEYRQSLTTPRTPNSKRTPLQSLENCRTAPKTVVVNPLNYLERCEKDRYSSKNPSNNNFSQKRELGTNRVVETGESRASTSRSAMPGNWLLFTPYPYESENRQNKLSPEYNVQADISSNSILQHSFHPPRPEQLYCRGSSFTGSFNQYQIPTSSGQVNASLAHGHHQPFQTNTDNCYPSATQYPYINTGHIPSRYVHSPLNAYPHLSLSNNINYEENDRLLRRSQSGAVSFPVAHPSEPCTFSYHNEEPLYDRNSQSRTDAFHFKNYMHSRNQNFHFGDSEGPSSSRDEDSYRYSGYFP